MFDREIYAQAIANGESPMFAEMLACRQPPGTRGTDRAFLQGRQNQEDLNMPKWMRDQLTAQMRKAGISTAGKVYISSLARKKHEVKPGEPWGAGDPYAWVSDLGEAKARCAALGREGWGAATVKASEVRPPTPDVPLAEDIVQGKVAEAIALDPSKANRIDEVRHEVIEKHAPKWGKGATKNFLKKVRLKK